MEAGHPAVKVAWLVFVTVSISVKGGSQVVVHNNQRSIYMELVIRQSSNSALENIHSEVLVRLESSGARA
jgi:hypothetical protein